MKLKYAIAAAAVLAASAQAAKVTSDATYAVITLPVAVGYNFYGVAVQPLAATTTYADYFGVADETVLRDDSGASTVDRDGTSVAVFKTPIWYNATAEGNLYEVGIDASDAAVDYAVSAGSSYALAITKDLTLHSFTEQLSKNSNRVSNAKANVVSLWDAAAKAYTSYFWSTRVNGWVKQGTSAKIEDPTAIKIPAGSAVYVQISSEYAGIEKLTL